MATKKGKSLFQSLYKSFIKKTGLGSGSSHKKMKTHKKKKSYPSTW